MPHLPTILAALLLCAAPLHAQTLKSLMFNSTNGQVVANTGTNVLTFSNSVSIDVGNGSMQFRITGDGVSIYSGAVGDDILVLPNDAPPVFANAYYWSDPSVRAAVGFSTNLNTLWTATNASSARSAVGLGATWLTNTNVTNFRTAIGLGETNDVAFQSIVAQGLSLGVGTNSWMTVDESGIEVNVPFVAIVNGGNLTNNGDLRINQTTPTNGLLFVYRTNNEPFLGLANLIASNNTTLSNETLFRVGRAEATNQAAQFGFRIVRTNNGGEGFATFSVFGYNALMMIGPSDRSRTNTNAGAAIEADIYTMTGTNRVMTLRDTNTGALTLHQDIGFGAGLTNNAPTNTNTPAIWLRVWVGTNNYRLPLYQ